MASLQLCCPLLTEKSRHNSKTNRNKQKSKPATATTSTTTATTTTSCNIKTTLGGKVTFNIIDFGQLHFDLTMHQAEEQQLEEVNIAPLGMLQCEILCN